MDPQKECYAFWIHFDVIILLNLEIFLSISFARYLERNPQYWFPAHTLVVKEIENVNKIKMTLFVNHTINFQDYPEKTNRRTELVLELKKIFEDLDITYYLLPQEIQISNTTTPATIHGHATKHLWPTRWLLLMAQ